MVSFTTFLDRFLCKCLSRAKCFGAHREVHRRFTISLCFCFVILIAAALDYSNCSNCYNYKGVYDTKAEQYVTARRCKLSAPVKFAMTKQWQRGVN